MKFAKLLTIMLVTLTNTVLAFDMDKSCGHPVPDRCLETYLMSPSKVAEEEGEGLFSWNRALGSGATVINHPKGQASMRWLTYSDPFFRFSIKYPDTYAAIEERPPGEDCRPRPVFRVYFQDKTILGSQTTNLEPPLFSIEIFEIPANTSYQAWLAQNQIIPPLSDTKALPISGRSGLHVTLREFIAPGEFVLVKESNRLFRLTLFGEHSAAMLESFRFDN